MNISLSSESSDSDLDSDSDSDSDFTVNTSTKKEKHIKLFTPELSAALDRTNTSDRNATYIIAATAAALGKDVKNVTLNRESIRLNRRKLRKESNRIIHDKFFTKSQLTVHWDGKLLSDLSGSDKVERTAILVTGIEIEKLLAVPKSTNSTGQTQANVVCEALDNWKLKDNITSMCFDTTASNSGVKSGACVLIEKQLGKRLLHLACRHHILELIVAKVHDSLFEKSTGPSIQLFNEFRNDWKNLNQKKYVSGMEDEAIFNLIVAHKPRIINLVREQLSQYQQRDDYKELLNLVLIFFGEKPSDNFIMLAPGAFHRARWMAKIIYCLKIYLFRGEREIESTTLNALRDFNVFIVLVYVKYWYLCPSPIIAPRNDLQLIKDIIKYNDVNENVASAAFSSFKNHMWYISETLIALSFFDSEISHSIKEKMIKRLSEVGSPLPLNRIKIDFSNISEKNIDDFVTNSTLNFFKILKLQTDFLKINPRYWNENEQYLHAKKVVQSLKV